MCIRDRLGAPNLGKSTIGASRKSLRRLWQPRRRKGNGSCKPTKWWERPPKSGLNCGADPGIGTSCSHTTSWERSLNSNRSRRKNFGTSSDELERGKPLAWTLGDRQSSKPCPGK
eukprot:3320880-Heterocapsa_arctica.AAC.1